MKIDIMRCNLVKEGAIEYNADSNRVASSEDAFEVFQALGYEFFAEEVFGMVTLNAKGAITSYHEVARGSLTEAVISPREVFKRALLANACSIIVAHNHPSGEVEPSDLDLALTARLREAGDMIGIKLVDHLIIGGNRYYSFNREKNL